MTVNCDLPSQEVNVGDTVTIEGTISNPTGTAARVEYEIRTERNGDVVDSGETIVRGGRSRAVSAVWATAESGSFTPEIALGRVEEA